MNLLCDIRTVFDRSSHSKLATETLLQGLAQLPESRWRGTDALALAKKLQPFDIRPKQLWLHGKNFRGYDIADFEDAFRRYLSAVPSRGGAPDVAEIAVPTTTKSDSACKSEVEEKKNPTPEVSKIDDLGRAAMRHGIAEADVLAEPVSSPVAEVDHQAPGAAANMGTDGETAAASDSRPGNHEYGLPDIPGAQIITVGSSAVLYLPEFQPPVDRWLEFLPSLPWKPRKSKRYGKARPAAREVIHFGLPYDVGPASKPPLVWDSFLIRFRKKLAELTGNTWEQCTCNRYPDGGIVLECHHDEHHPLLIATISFGAPRHMGFCAHDKVAIDYSLPLVKLDHGSLVLFSGTFNATYKHGIIEDGNVTEPRTSITFRHFAETK